MTTKAFLDTTVLVDATLKEKSLRESTTAALARFTERQLPVYAIKEFKAGPLSYYAWFHNRLVNVNSFAAVIGVLQSISRTPQRYRTATALSALQAAATDFGSLTNQGLVARYGQRASLGTTICDLVRLNVQQRVFTAWKKRRKIATAVVEPMKCYSEDAPYLKRGMIEIASRQCRGGSPCDLSGRIKADPDLLERLHASVKAVAEQKQENAKRARVLKDLVRKPREPLLPEGCRALGDAVFVILAPADSTILTTNTRDFVPLAAAAGKAVERPQEPSSAVPRSTSAPERG